MSLVCSRATQPGEKSTEKSCERRVCQLKAYNSPQTTSEQTGSNNEQQQQRTTTTTNNSNMHNTDMGKRQGSNRCGLPVTRTEIAARKCRTKAATCQGGRERGCGAGGARRFGHTSHVLPKGETTKHALQATPHNTLNWMLWLSANGIGIQIEMRWEWDSMEAAKQSRHSAVHCHVGNLCWNCSKRG